VIVPGTVLLSPGHAPGEEVEPDTPALRGLAEEEEPGGQLGAALAPEVAAEAGDEPVRGLRGLLGLLQKVVIFAIITTRQQAIQFNSTQEAAGRFAGESKEKRSEAYRRRAGCRRIGRAGRGRCGGACRCRLCGACAPARRGGCR
jgi:hypothetical protein